MCGFGLITLAIKYSSLAQTFAGPAFIERFERDHA